MRLDPVVFAWGGSVGRRLVGRGTSGSVLGEVVVGWVVGCGLDPESGMRIVSSVTKSSSRSASPQSFEQRM